MAKPLKHPTDPPIPFDVTAELAKGCPSSIARAPSVSERIAYALIGAGAMFLRRDVVITTAERGA